MTVSFLACDIIIVKLRRLCYNTRVEVVSPQLQYVSRLWAHGLDNYADSQGRLAIFGGTMENSKISWTDNSWNPVTGCTQVSPGCDNCYAKRIAEQKRGPAFPKGFDITLRPHKLRDPLKWKEPKLIFVNSMSDLFHRDIPQDYLSQVWATMCQADWHTYQVLTKRAHRMAHLIKTLNLPTPPHIWLGVSAENQQMADSRIPPLLTIPAPVRFISAEPLLGPIDLTPYLSGLAWVIDGGESGSGRRPAEMDWFRSLRDQCDKSGVAYYHKQGNAHMSGRDVELDGVIRHAYPDTGGHAEAARRAVAQTETPKQFALAG